MRVPEEVPEGRYTLWLGGGSEADRYMATRLPARFRPTSIADAWARFGQFAFGCAYSSLWARAPEITAEGRDYPELPSSTLSVMSAPQMAGDRARRGDWVSYFDEQRLPLPGALRGELLLEVETKSP